MAECDRSLDLISLRLDGPLEAQETVQLDDHLSQCAACRALCADLERLHSALSSLGESTPPEGFADGVLEKLRHDSPAEGTITPMPRRRYWHHWAAIAACAVLVFGVVRWSPLLFPRGASTAAPAAGGEAPMAQMAPAASFYNEAATATDEGTADSAAYPADAPPTDGLSPSAGEEGAGTTFAAQDAHTQKQGPMQAYASTSSARSGEGLLNGASFDAGLWESDPTDAVAAIHQELVEELGDAALSLLFLDDGPQNVLPDSPNWLQGVGYRYLPVEGEDFSRIMQTASWINCFSGEGGGYYLVVMEP